MVKIYSLTHPSSTRIYIGKTSRELKRRMYGHMDESSRYPNLRKSKWIKSLVKKGLKPEIRLIEEVSDELGNEKEKYYIKLGWETSPKDMLNSPNMPGGEGFSKGKNISKEARARSAANRRKFTNEELQKIADRINSGEFMKDIAKEYGVHKVTIMRNLNGVVGTTEKIQYRTTRTSGSKHHNSKINHKIAAEIRGKYSSGKYFQYQLAEEFGIAQATVWSILKNEIWKKN